MAEYLYRRYAAEEDAQMAASSISKIQWVYTGGFYVRDESAERDVAFAQAVREVAAQYHYTEYDCYSVREALADAVIDALEADRDA